VIDLREERANVFHPLLVKSESVSNEIDEIDLHNEKHDEQRI
jgi:hypothetical protein